MNGARGNATDFTDKARHWMTGSAPAHLRLVGPMNGDLRPCVEVAPATSMRSRVDARSRSNRQPTSVRRSCA